jgi:bifunctional UDP-N-acetylglucosamine pyrophosphorylase/glucosamine-1-phosphate N-acetyltransferase
LIRPRGPVFVVTGRLPLLRIETLRLLAGRQDRGSLDLAFLSFRPPDGAGFAPVARDASGHVTAIAAEKVSASGEALPEVDAGVYCFAPRALERVLARLPGSASARGGLAGAVALLATRPGKVEAVEAEDWREAWSIRTRRDLAAAEEIGRRRAVDRALDRGATIVDPNSTRIGPLVEMEPDVVVHPFVSLEGRSVLGEGCEVHSFTRVADSVLGPRVAVLSHCDIEGAAIGARCRVGPFSRLRPGTVLEEDVRVGNFVETKAALLRRGVKALHLSYLGDAEIGADTNIGAGVITCNYDGQRKHRTAIGRGAFIGSDSQLVAPVTVGDGAYVGAGSTITKDVPGDALSLTRAPQKTVAGWAARRRKERTRGRGDTETR